MTRTKLQLVLEAIDRASAPLGKVDGALAKIGKTAKIVAVAGIAATVAVLTNGVNEARKFESAMADVAKVANFNTPDGLAQMSDDILDMSRHIPVAAEGLATITAEALQSGIALEDALDFTALTAKSAVAFDMTADAAGEAFAKIRNVMNLDQNGITDMADAVNHLSNNMAAKAPQIINFLTRAGGAADMLGLAADDMAAFGSSLVALGVMPETAARGTTKLFTSLKLGGKKVEGAFAAIGLSHADFLAQLDSNPAAAFEDLFKALGQSENGLQSLIDLVGTDFVDDFSKLSANPKILAQAFGLMADETQRAGSVLAEYEARAATFDNTIALFQNNLKAMSIELGMRMLPTLNKALGGVVNVMQTLDERVTVIDRFKSVFSGFADGLGLSSAVGELTQFAAAFGAVSDFLFGKDLTGVDEGLAKFVRAEDASALAAMAAQAKAFGASLAEISAPLTGALMAAGGALGAAFGEGGAARAALAWLGAANFATGGAVLRGLADTLRILTTAAGELVTWIGGKAQGIDWTALVGRIDDIGHIDAMIGVITGFFEAVKSLVQLGVTSLKAFASGYFEGFAPYMAELSAKLGPIADQIAPILDKLGAIFMRIGEALGLLSANDEAMGSVRNFGVVMGDLAGQLAGLALDSISGVLSFVDGILTIIERLLAGDTAGAMAPIQQFFDWLGSLTIGSMLPDINVASVVATIKGWFAFEWSEILPSWDWASIIPDAPNIKSWFSWGDDAPKSPVANDNVPNLAPVKAAQADVDALGVDIAAVTGAANAMPATVRAAMNAVRLAADLDLTPQGRKIMDTLAAGMRARAQAVVNEIKAVTQQVRDHLPSSPAKTGPLSDIHRLKFGETIAQSIRAQPMVAAMNRAAALTRAAANFDMPAPSGPNVVGIRSRSASAGVGGSTLGAGAGGGSTISVDASLTIQGNVAFATDADKGEFEALLKRHSKAVAEAVDAEVERRARLAF